MEYVSFFEDFKTNLIEQYEQCPAYKLICKNQNFNPRTNLKSEKDLEFVPFIATTLFKKSAELFSSLLRTSPENIEKWTISSSTSGDPSIIGRNHSDISELKKFINLNSKEFNAKCDYECVFYPRPEVMRLHKSKNILGKHTESYIGNILQSFPYNDNAVFLLIPSGEDFTIDVDSFINFIKKHDKKNHRISLSGSSLLLYNIYEQLKEKISPVELGSTSIVSTGGGGWDGRKGTVNTGVKIEKWRFVENLSTFLGIPEENFIDTYSFTENSFPISGHYSKKYKDYLFHVPKWGRIIIRDTKTLKPLKNVGDRGFLQVLNAYGTSAFSGASLLVDDIAEIVSTTHCPECGREGTIIRIIERVRGSEAKGCGATLSIKEENK